MSGSDDDTTFKPDIDLIEVAYETVEELISNNKISEGAYYALCRSIKLAYDHSIDSDEYESDISIDDFIVDDNDSISGGLTESESDDSDDEEEDELFKQEQPSSLDHYLAGASWATGFVSIALVAKVIQLVLKPLL